MMTQIYIMQVHTYTFSIHEKCGESLSKGPFLFNGQKISKANYGVLSFCKNRTKFTILSREDDQNSEVSSFLEDLRRS